MAEKSSIAQSYAFRFRLYSGGFSLGARRGPFYPLAGGAFASDIIDTIKYLWEKGNASTLIIEKDGKQLLNLSLTMGTIGLVIAPVAAIPSFGNAARVPTTPKGFA